MLTRRMLILTRHRQGASFRQRVESYLPVLTARGIGVEVLELAASPLRRRSQWRRAADFDGVLIQRKTLTAWDDLCLGRSARRLMYDFDDAVIYQARRPDRPHAGRLRRFARTVRRADLVIAGSPVLADLARQSGARQVEVLPTGLDAARLAPKTDYTARRPLRLVWIGSRSTLKQVAALGPTLAAIGSAVPDLALRVIADAPLQVPGLEVENVPWSLEAEGRLLAECDIGIAPMPDTPFTRGKCGFKILQYMAAGLPVVASPVGANAEYVRPDHTGFHATTTQEWVAAVRRLASDMALRERLGREGRRRVETEFDLAVLAPRFCDLIVRTLT